MIVLVIAALATVLLLSLLVLKSRLLPVSSQRQRMKRPSRPIVLPREVRVEALRFLDHHTLHHSVRFVGLEWNEDVIHSIGVREKFQSLEFDTDYLGSQFHRLQLHIVDDGYFHVWTSTKKEKVPVLTELETCCQDLRVISARLLNQQFFTDLGENMLIKVTASRPPSSAATSTITFYCPNRIESEEAAFKLLHFLSHLDRLTVTLHLLELKESQSLNRPLVLGTLAEMGVGFNAHELRAKADEIPPLLHNDSIIESVAEAIFDDVQVADPAVMQMVGEGRRYCREKIMLHAYYTEGEDEDTEEAQRHHPIETVTEHLEHTLTSLREMVPEIVIEQRNSIKQFSPWRWPRTAFPSTAARRVGRQGFYSEARHVYEFIRTNTASGERFSLTIEVQQPDHAMRGGEEVLSATFRRCSSRDDEEESEPIGSSDKPSTSRAARRDVDWDGGDSSDEDVDRLNRILQVFQLDVNNAGGGGGGQHNPDRDVPARAARQQPWVPGADNNDDLIWWGEVGDGAGREGGDNNAEGLDGEAEAAAAEQLVDNADEAGPVPNEQEHEQSEEEDGQGDGI